MDIKQLHKAGNAIKGITRLTGHSRNTVRAGVAGAKTAAFSNPNSSLSLRRVQTICGKALPGMRPLQCAAATRDSGSGLQGLSGHPLSFHANAAGAATDTEQTIRYETPPGEQAQADWTYCGRFADQVGNLVSVYAFVMVVSFSRMLYVEFTRSMKLPALLQCHQNAFAFFGGWPHHILYDNMKQVRLSPRQLQPQFLDFANHYGFAIKTHQSGVSRGSFGSFVVGDKFRVSVEAGVVKYRKNGTLVYTSTVSPTYPLVADASLYLNGRSVSNAVISVMESEAVSWTNAAGVTISGSTLTKTAATGWANAGASSAQSIVSGDGYVEYTATDTDYSSMVGLTHTDSDMNYVSIDFAIFPQNGVVSVYESGVSRGSFGNYVIGDKFRVSVEGGVVKYRKNGTLVYTSTVSPTYPLVADASLYLNGRSVSNAVISGNLSIALRYVLQDVQGSTRAVMRSNQITARHDFLPFGEELGAGTGLRTTAQGYGAIDKIRQRYGLTERDDSSGLDHTW